MIAFRPSRARVVEHASRPRRRPRAAPCEHRRLGVRSRSVGTLVVLISPVADRDHVRERAADVDADHVRRRRSAAGSPPSSGPGSRLTEYRQLWHLVTSHQPPSESTGYACSSSLPALGALALDVLPGDVDVLLRRARVHLHQSLLLRHSDRLVCSSAPRSASNANRPGCSLGLLALYESGMCHLRSPAWRPRHHRRSRSRLSTGPAFRRRTKLGLLASGAGVRGGRMVLRGPRATSQSPIRGRGRGARSRGLAVAPEREPAGERGVEVVFVLRADEPERLSSRGVGVEYTVDGKDHRALLPTSFAVCPRAVGEKVARECAAPLEEIAKSLDD